MSAHRKDRVYTMDQLYTTAQEKMEKSIGALQKELATLRAGRATPVLDRITVDYYGVPTPVNQMSSVSVVEARILQIQPYDVSTLKDIEKAILASDLGLTPQNDGRVIRLNFPQPTEERRKELAKQAAKMGEEAKVAIRSIRRDILDKYKAMKKNSEITEDDLKNAEKKMQDLTDKFCKEIDEIAAKKDKEIMEI